MAATLLPILASGNGIVFAFENSTVPGKCVLVALFIASVFSWTVMWTKWNYIRRAQLRRDQFLDLFRTDRQPLRIYTDRSRFEARLVFSSSKPAAPSRRFNCS